MGEGEIRSSIARLSRTAAIAIVVLAFVPAALLGVAALRHADIGLALLVITGTLGVAGAILAAAHALKEADQERRRVRGALETHVEQLRDLYDNAPCGYHSLAADGTYLQINQTELGWLGLSREDVVGRKKFSDFLTPESRRRFEVAFPRFKREGVATDVEFELVRRDGSTVDVLMSATALTDDAGRYVMSRSTLYDMTERKRAERMAAAAKEEAERANRAKSEFLSQMSHELRTPLTAILGFGELLQHESLGERERSYVDQITRGGRHLLDLINELLDISRIEAGDMTISLESIHLAPVLRDALGLVEPLARERGIAIRAELDEAAEESVFADLQRLKQVLLNLLSNAVKYNREGGVVTVSLAPVPGERLRILVSDTGWGIPAEAMGRVFLPFERLDAEGGPVQGTGLGLALTKGLVETMGGSIAVESEAGSGTTFSVELALDTSGDEAAASAPDEPAGAPAVAGRTLLYIEDNPSNVQLVESVFARHPGVRLLTAFQGSLGVQLARQHRPDLVLLDLHLPDISGEVVLHQLRADARTAGIPVIVLSADATKGQVKRMLASGAEAYLTKPLDVQGLLDTVERSLRPVAGAGA